MTAGIFLVLRALNGHCSFKIQRDEYERQCDGVKKHDSVWMVGRKIPYVSG